MVPFFRVQIIHPSIPSHISKNPTETFPLVLQPISNSSAKNISIKEWVKETEFWIEEVLHKYGAILVRGLPLSSADDFSHFIDSFNYEPMDYTSGMGIRNVVSGNVSTASNELSSVSLEPHNEMAYTRNYPSKILFFAQTPAPKGGEGVIVDVREYAKLLDPEIKQKLQETEIKYIRFLQDRRFGGYTSWQDSFLTNDKEVAIKFMNEHNYDFN
ncbi:MAG: hypothetical protein F6K22_27295 [Okeania sp. SIO2F4]|nr:hypothetical protein [Okeania sp. SIO2F4]